MAKLPRHRSNSGQIDRFLARSRHLSRPGQGDGRLIFAIDATASRQATWDQACQLQAGMFMAARGIGELSVQLCYYRGFNGFHASPWLQDQTSLLRQMSRVRCEGGYTQILRLLQHAEQEQQRKPVRALVFIGDACEENHDLLAGKAGELGIAGLPLFMFQEAHDHPTEQLFRHMARLSRGAWARFDHRSAGQLAELLGAVARYATGGTASLLEYSEGAGAGVKLLLEQLKQDPS